MLIFCGRIPEDGFRLEQVWFENKNENVLDELFRTV